MIRGEPNPISSGRNEAFAQPFVGYRKRGKSFTEGENKREIKGQIRVVLRPVSLVLFTVKKKNLSREKRKEKKKKRESKEDKRAPQPMTAKTTL